MKTLPPITPRHVKVGSCDYVLLACGSREEADARAFNICHDTMLPVYFGSGYTINHPHILRIKWPGEIVLQIYPHGSNGLAGMHKEREHTRTTLTY